MMGSSTSTLLNNDPIGGPVQKFFHQKTQWSVFDEMVITCKTSSHLKPDLDHLPYYYVALLPRRGPHIVRRSQPHKLVIIINVLIKVTLNEIRCRGTLQSQWSTLTDSTSIYRLSSADNFNRCPCDALHLFNITCTKIKLSNYFAELKVFSSQKGNNDEL